MAAVIRQSRLRDGQQWTVDEVFYLRGKQKLYLYHAVDAHGQVLDVMLRDKRNRASAEAFFRQAVSRTEVTPKAIITDHHQPYTKAVAAVIPFARHDARSYIAAVATPPSPSSGATSPPAIDSEAPEDSEPFTLGSGLWRALKPCLHVLRRGTVKLRTLVPRYQPTSASGHERARTCLTDKNSEGSFPCLTRCVIT